MLIGKGCKLVMVGDSVTDADRKRPVGEGRGDDMGRSYVALVNALLTAACPQERIRVVNMGIAGDTSRSLLARFQTDVLALEPDWLTIMIGVNDVWRQFDAPLQPEIHVYPDEYEANLVRLMELCRGRVKQTVLFTPVFMEKNRQDEMREMLDSYSSIVRKTASRYGALLVDAQAAYDEALGHMHPMNIAWDRVHPNMTGHMLIARAFLKSVGFVW
ncbi:SGNH/GDSL hydrolase family protein [Paenibacillus sp. YN15]|uniref:SGNH/GDSL hydrolase family protein n=1 Tax=Paenibacillus sp. YN15 TaxID=1742774 RepID=UPI000DCF5F2D|nr:SGNH/GDSL hydrolase family protein [Paenibacillus sp. YN15]RAV06393.1 GDSL family lipase [Paenibacillus sp. YN15]